MSWMQEILKVVAGLLLAGGVTFQVGTYVGEIINHGDDSTTQVMGPVDQFGGNSGSSGKSRD